MNKKGQDMMAGILIAFVGIIVGLVIYQAINPFVGDMTGANRGNVTNLTVTAPAVGSSIDLTGQELIGVGVAINSTDPGVNIPATNISIAEGVKSTGVKGIILRTLDDEVVADDYLNISYEYYPDGYIDNSGARGITLLIPIFAALAIALVGLVPSLRSGIMESLGK